MHLRRTGSTNDWARRLAIAGAPHGTLVTATEQTAGKGRQGRVWVAPPPSALLASLILRDPPELLSLTAAVAVCDAIDKTASIKWPNDIVVGKHLAKLAGILVEGRPQEGWAVLGIGVNVAVRIEELPGDVRERAASMEREPSEIEPLLERLVASLERRLGEPAPTVLEAWRARDALLGRNISWTQGAGRAEGIDEQGRLIVCLPSGDHMALDSGEVHLESIWSQSPV